MKEDFIDKWHKVVKIITDNIGEQRAMTWFAVAVPQSYIDNRLQLQLPSEFFVEKYENEFYGVLTFAMHKVFGPGVKLDY